MNGKIVKIHSDFYYVNTGEIIVECKVREILKKEKINFFVGDDVEIENYVEASNQAVITKLIPRNNYIPRPSVSNVDLIIIVTTFREPSLDYDQLNRYLCNAIRHEIPAVICVNKSDLINSEKEIEEFISIYKPLGYEIIFSSSLKKTAIECINEITKGKTCVLTGVSGVGKSSLLNTMNPELHLKTKKVSNKLERGTHTTRHSEIINIDKTTNIIDTPGFSLLRFDNMLPKDIERLFPDIEELASDCKFSDCLHLTETGCNVLKNLDKIPKSRYSSYKNFLAEAKEFKEKIKYQGHKEEAKSKLTGLNQKILKISNKTRDFSRKKQNQNLNFSYYNKEDI